MKIKINTSDFRVKEGDEVNVKTEPTAIDSLYDSKKQYKGLLREYVEEVAELQNMMYAHDRYSLLLIFQGMDTAGKDGAIKHVMTGINPAGCMVRSFKKPSSIELDHDYMWRCTKELPQRGRIGIFNRSYYEEVLVLKVHPEILNYQRIPRKFTTSIDEVWKGRYEDIKNFERYLHRNGTVVLKFFLHISKEEQRQRLLDRINTPAKNWKMSPQDVKERQHWAKYQHVFSECIQKTTTEDSPWFIIPGDDKKNARLIISQIILEKMRELDIHYPKVTDSHRAELAEIRTLLENEK